MVATVGLLSTQRPQARDTSAGPEAKRSLNHARPTLTARPGVPSCRRAPHDRPPAASRATSSRESVSAISCVRHSSLTGTSLLELLLDSERPMLALLARPHLLSAGRRILRGGPDAIAAPLGPTGLGSTPTASDKPQPGKCSRATGVRGHHTLPHKGGVRAKVILYAAEGQPTAEIARRLETAPRVVGRWRKRFFEERLAGSRIGSVRAARVVRSTGPVACVSGPRPFRFPEAGQEERSSDQNAGGSALSQEA